MWQPITDLSQMETQLLHHRCEHFSQAHGTTFTNEPLASLLQYNGLTPFGDDVFNGTIPPELEIPPTAKLLLEHLSSKLNDDEQPNHPLEFEELMNGFQKWPEQTATLPSGHHLGIYKLMLKDLPNKDDHKKNPPIQ